MPAKTANALDRGRRGPGPGQRRRSAETRERVIEGVIELIAEQGMAGVTASGIARQTGVSWGGVQHQFGDKAAVLDAVLDHILDRFQSGLAAFSTRATSLEGRVRALVDATWTLLRDPAYGAFRELMRSQSAASAAGLRPQQVMAQVTSALVSIETELFADLAPDASTLDLVNTVLFATLSGAGEQERYADYPAALTARQLAVLRDTLIRLLRDELPPGAGVS
jgi:AcrR family transcriptional regulator